MSNPIRIISRLDIKGSNVIKGIQLEGLRIVGDPKQLASKYYEQGIDELLYVDVVASLYGRNSLTDIVKYTARNIFVPITVCGGVRSIQDIYNLLNSGADRVAINTAAIKNPKLLEESAKVFGSQCIVLSIEAKKNGDSSWEAYYDNGRERSNLNVLTWAKIAEDLGVGEILLTSVDREGTRSGFDISLIKAVTDLVQIPVIASGGLGRPEDFIQAVQAGKANGVAIADAFHYERHSVNDIRKAANTANITVRQA